MSKRHTSKVRRHPRSKVLEVRVMSPRIAWLGFLRLTGSLTRYALILAAVGGISAQMAKAIYDHFHEGAR